MKLIISPHVDDEVLECGGILDSSFKILHLGLSDNCLHGNINYSRMERLKEFNLVLKHLDIQNGHILLNHEVNNYRQQNLIADIESVINEYQPCEVFIPHPSYNQDHRETYEACLIALRPHDINHFVKKVFVYEQPQVFLWNNNYHTFKPNYFIPIDIEKKLILYNYLASQVRDFRSPDCIKAMAKLRGSQSRTQYAEAFEIMRYIA